MTKKKDEPEKDPREMTTDELASFVFHPKVVDHVKRAVHEPRKPPKKK